MHVKRCTLFALGLLSLASVGCQTEEAASSPAASNSASEAASDSNLDQVASNAPAVLYFIKSSCGSNPRAIPLVNRIYAANANSGKFYAVIDVDQATSAEWAKEWEAKFPIIADPDKKIIKQYGIEASQTGVLVDKDLKETMRFPGYGREVLERLNASLAGAGNAAKVDLADAPESGVG